MRLFGVRAENGEGTSPTAAAWARPRPHEWAGIALLLALTYRQRWVMDDATIYFRYVDNWLLSQRGLVFNAGEYVEGFTSPLWLLLLAAGRALGAAYWPLTLALGLACALLSGLLLVDVNRRLSGNGPVVNLPLALMAGHYGMQTHFTSGLESGLVQLMGPWTAAFLLRPQHRLLQVGLGLAPLVRPELTLVSFGTALFAALSNRRLPWVMLATGALTGGGWLLFRVYYYADLLPNTYYLKGHVDWSQGLRYLELELLGAQGVLIASALAVIGRLALPSIGRHDRQGTWARGWMLALATVSVLWAVRVGGDMAYHRFFAFPFSLGLCALAGLAERILAPSAPPARAAAVFAFALVLSLVSYPREVVRGHPLFAHAKPLQWHGIEDALWHRRHASLSPADEAVRAAEDRAVRSTHVAQREASAPAARRLQAFCAWAHLHPDVHVVHTYGLTDAVLARVDAETRRPGHRRLWHHARDLLRAQELGGDGPLRYRRAVRSGKAAPWIARSLPTIEVIERKVHNRHDLAENLGLALTRVPPIPR